MTMSLVEVIQPMLVYMQLVSAAITVGAQMLQQCLQSLPVVAVRVGQGSSRE